MRIPTVTAVLFLVACGGGGSSTPHDAGDDGSPGSACSAGAILCDGACVDPSAREHCGRCGHDCAAGEACDRGTCVASCAGHRLAIDRPLSPASDPELIAAGDFDGDGELDVVAVGDSAVVMYGNGDGVFGRHRAVEPPSSPHALFSGDVDGDGDDDILIVGYELATLINDGQGGFTRTEIDGLAFSDPVAADFDGDGRLDLALIGGGGGEIRFGQPGGLGAPVAIAGGYPRAITTGDADGDGDVDLIFHDGSNLVVLRNDGAGAFPATVTTVAAATPDFLVAGDFVGDDLLDVIGIDEDGLVLLYPGGGGGAFGAGAAVELPRYTWRRITDLDGDGKDDLVTANGGVCVYAGGATGLAAPRCVAAPERPQVAVLGDVMGSPADDVIVGGDQTIGVIPVDASGALDAPTISPLGSYTRSSSVVDFDGDGRSDLVAGVVYDEAIHVVSGATGVATTIAVFSTVGQPSDVAVVDLDGGDLDLLVATYTGVEMLLGAGGLTSGTTTQVIAGTGFGFDRVAAGDVDGDGDLDLVALDDDRTRVRVFPATGPGEFATIPSATIQLTDTADLAVAEVTGDGRDDVIVSSDDQLLVYPGQVGGTLGASITSQGSGAKRPILRDLDGDGDLDVMLRGLWLAGDGAGGFGDPRILSFYADVLWIGDFDLDGATDVLLEIDDALQLARGTTDGFVIDQAWRIDGGFDGGGIGDADGDGELDLLLLQSGGARIVLGAAAGFALDRMTPVPQSIALARGDIDEDGRDDLVLLSIAREVHVLLAEAGGTVTFRASQIVPGAEAVHLVDADLDGHLDLVVDAAVHRGDGTGTFAAPVDPPVGAARTSSIGFVDRDAYPDLVVQSQVVGYTRTWFGGPDGFREGPELPRSVHACALDLDSDGAGDLATATLGGYVLETARGDGAGVFGAGTVVPGMYTGLTTTVTCGDADGDGHPDVVATDVGLTLTGYGRSLAVVRGDGSGLGDPELVELGFPAATVDLALLDGAGSRSLIAGGYFFQVAELDGTIRTSDRLVGAAVSGDFDGDAVLDVAIGTGGGVLVYRGSCP